MNFLPDSLKTLSLAALLCISATAYADITVHTDRAAFLAAVSAPATDGFNDLPQDMVATPLQRTAGAYSYMASTSEDGFFPAGTSSDVWLSTTLETAPITFSAFSSGVRAFGGNFFGSDVDGAFLPGVALILSATDGANTITVNLDNTTTATFLGFVSPNPLAFVTLQIGAASPNLFYGTANDVVLAVPEPATWGMLLAGIGLIGFAACRRTE